MLSNDEVSGSVDLWALGCIIFQMLVGKPPFKVQGLQLVGHAACSCTHGVAEAQSVQQHKLAPAARCRFPLMVLLTCTAGCQRISHISAGRSMRIFRASRGGAAAPC